MSLVGSADRISAGADTRQHVLVPVNPPPGRQSRVPADHPHAPTSAPQARAARRNNLGRIALSVSIIGFMCAGVPGAVFLGWASRGTAIGVVMIAGWVLLPIAFILGVCGLLRSGEPKAASAAAVLVSVVGAVVGAIVFLLMMVAVSFQQTPPIW